MTVGDKDDSDGLIGDQADVATDVVLAPQCESSFLPLIGDQMAVPGIIRREGQQASMRFVEFFTAHIRNPNTRSAYGRAVGQFLAWCEDRGLQLGDLQPVVVATYIEGLRGAPATVKQHLAAIRMLMDWMILGQVIPHNPAAAVRGPKHVVKKGKTPVLDGDAANALLESIDTTTLPRLRDRALIGTMIYTFARVSATVGLRLHDYFPQGKRWWLRLHEKGGRYHEVPVHHKLEEYLDEWIEAAGLREGEDKNPPLFPTLKRGTDSPSSRPMTRIDAASMVKRRAKKANLPPSISCHSFRATGITNYLQNGGSLEIAQAIAAHESPRTTKLYDRTGDEISLEEIERIRL